MTDDRLVPKVGKFALLLLTSINETFLRHLHVWGTDTLILGSQTCGPGARTGPRTLLIRATTT